MAIAVTELITRILQHVSDAGNPGGANSYLVGLINTVHAELMLDCRMVVNTQATINLVSQQAEYALDPTTGRIWDCLFYSQSGQVGSPLIPTNIDELTETNPSWRDPNISTTFPSEYYVDGSNIGFWPIPNTTTSGGFPNVVVWSDNVPTLTGASSLPSQITEANVNAWVYGVLMYHCIAKKRSDAELFGALYKQQKSMLIRLQNGRMQRDPGGIRMRLPQVLQP